MLSVIGHRGAPVAHRENTIAAFLEAVRLGADGIELDVRRAADGALVVHHDAVLPDGTAISNIRGDELPTWVPTLPAVFDAIPAEVFIDVEIKNMPNEPDWDPAESVAAAVASLIGERARHDTTLVTSFNLNAIQTVRAITHTIPTGWLTLPGYDQAAAIQTIVDGNHQAILPRHESVDAALCDLARQSNVRVITWTVDDPDRIRQLAALDIDGIITNRPDVALDALRQ